MALPDEVRLHQLCCDDTRRMIAEKARAEEDWDDFQQGGEGWLGPELVQKLLHRAAAVWFSCCAWGR